MSIKLIGGTILSPGEYHTYRCPTCHTVFKIRPIDMLVDHWEGTRYCKCPHCCQDVGYGIDAYEEGD